MIKKIPIKGISRDPSGQISGDGFCSESLNVQLDMGEVAPAINPKRVKDAAGNEISVEGEILFIHKGIGYENLIYRNANVLSYVAVIGNADSGLVYDGLAYDETVNDITSIGNTVIVSTSKDMYYILWKDGEYRFLGNEIPIPAIHFRMGNLEEIRTEPNVNLNIDWDDPDMDDFKAGYNREGEDEAPIFPHKAIGDVTPYALASKRYVFDSEFEKGYWAGYLDAVWSEIDQQVQEQTRLGRAVFPVFVRYAVRLYDGTVYAQSIPILVGSDIGKFVDVKSLILQENFIRSDGAEEHGLTIAASLIKLAKSYELVMNADGQGMRLEGWEDIVTSVDIFVSPQIMPMQRNAAKFNLEFMREDTTALNIVYRAYYVRDFFLDPYYTMESQDKLVRYYQNTYLAQSFSVDEFKSLSGDNPLQIDFSSDYIMAQEALKETSQSMHHTVGSRLFSYNKRLLLADTTQSVSHGYQFLHSTRWVVPGSTATPIRFVYYLRGEGGDATVFCRDANNNTQITPKRAKVVSGSQMVYEEAPVSWLAYPDSRCYRVDIYFLAPGGQVLYSSYKMTPMDQIDVSFVFFGFGIPVIPVGIAPSTTPAEKTTFRIPNTLAVSKPNNPFIFPAEDAITFTAGEILNLAVANVPLSEGQFGQFPLYVFTDEGVFAITVDAEGQLRTSHNVSRDVLISKDAVIGIEQGVFFAAARGLLLLQGSKVTKVSSQMEGLPDILAEELLGRISDQLLGFFPDNPQAFRYFLSDCFLAYDYANTRIIVLNPRFNAQYVYKFDSQSWHRLQTDFAKPVRALNSFPEAQIVMQSGNRQAVLDFSVLAENEDAEPLKGFIYTRDLSLDGADIYKTISRLKVRGRFKDGHVKWQLQGSNDGIDYHTIHSLRGPSWKWYRIVLVTLLDKDERISYIELDYTPRFTDKIR